MQTILSDPTWQGIGGVAAVLAVIVAIGAFVQNRPRRALTYEVLASLPVLSQSEELGGELQVTFKERPVKDARVVVLQIVNDGTQPIAMGDFASGLFIHAGPGSSVLNAEVLEVVPSNLRPTFAHEESASQIVVHPLLLNAGDIITLRVLFAEWIEPITVDARIAGIGEIAPYRTTRNWAALFAYLAIVTPLVIAFVAVWRVDTTAEVRSAVSLGLMGISAGSSPLIDRIAARGPRRRSVVRKRFRDSASSKRR